MKRRSVIAGLAAGALAALAYRYWPDEGFSNPCLTGEVPVELLEHEIVQSAWQGLDTKQVWDCHVHLVGAGPLPFTWLNPAMRSFIHPIWNAQYRFYLDAACLNEAGDINGDYIQRLLNLHRSLAPGAKLMLLAFDYCRDNEGHPLPRQSLFYVSNDYAAQVAKRYPAQFEWMASIHPYRHDGLEALDMAIRSGARAIKWLPPAMGIDPSSSRCDAFYRVLAKSNLPLLTHGRDEHAVAAQQQALGNPLLLRRALDHGVRVIVAHCASLGISFTGISPRFSRSTATRRSGMKSWHAANGMIAWSMARTIPCLPSCRFTP
jgi:mannonate dehydratase